MPGNGADAPFLNMVVPQNLCFEFRGHAHGALLSNQVNVKGDVSDGAGSHDAQIDLATCHRNDSAMATAMYFPRATSERPVVNHLRSRVGNSDASFLFVGSGSGTDAQHGCGDHADSSDSVDRQF